MQLLMTSEARFERTPDGAIWAPGPWGRQLWNRYLAVFDQVRVMARVFAVREPSAGLVTFDPAGVSFAPLESYSGLIGLLRNVGRIDAAAAAFLKQPTAIILRLPSPIAFRVGKQALRTSTQYGVEVVGDPEQVFAPGVIDHPLRPLLRLGATRGQRRLCAAAFAALYVTERTLQAKYPSNGQVFAASDVDLAKPPVPAIARRPGQMPMLVTVASLDQPYKGISVLLKAVALLHRNGLAVRLCIVGGGRLQQALTLEAEALGLSASVQFAGQVPGAAVESYLSAADVFVLPSLTEGLPRALVEAMARGLPAVASAVGGIPELLPGSCLAEPGDTAGLAARLTDILRDDERRRSLAHANVRRAADFSEHRLSRIRREFFERVKEGSMAPAVKVCA
jgi:glycosyltransferase involved in cell wall biosynthesis